MEGEKTQNSLFTDLTNSSKSNSNKAFDENEDIHQPTEVESLCVNCGENGVTTLLLAKIPHYREVILSSFACELCGFKNNNIQSGGAVQDQGIIYKVLNAIEHNFFGRGFYLTVNSHPNIITVLDHTLTILHY